MLDELTKRIEELKNYYDDGTMMSMHESICGIQLCESFLDKIKQIELLDIPIENKIDLLKEYLNDNKKRFLKMSQGVFLADVRDGAYLLNTLNEIIEMIGVIGDVNSHQKSKKSK